MFKKSMGQKVLPNNLQIPHTPVSPKDLVPEFDLSVPSTGDDLGGFVWMPQGTDANLVMSLDPVIKLGGLPIPNVELSVCVTRHHIAGRNEENEREKGAERWMERLTLCSKIISFFTSPAKRWESLRFLVFSLVGSCCVAMVTERT